MRKKLVAIMAAVLAILIIIAVVLGMKGKDKDTDDKSGNDVEIEAEAGLEESIFDDEDVNASDAESTDSDNKDESEDVNTSKTPEEVIIGDEPAGNTGNQQSTSGKKPGKTEKPDKSDKDDKNDKDSSNKKPSVQEDGKMTYEAFHAMDPSDQQAYMESFDDIDEFFEWYNDAKEQYEKENPSIEVDGGAIDLDKIANED